MKLKFLVNSSRSADKNFLSLEVSVSGKTHKKLDPCPVGDLKFEIDGDKNTVVDFIITNKKGNYTYVKNGKIISDTILILKKIECNGYDLTGKANLFSNYKTEKNGNIRTNGYMGFNGTYRFKFRHPSSRHILLCEYH